jgi:hypothetical protein
VQERSRYVIVATLLIALILQIILHIWFPFSYRTPRLVTLAVAVIGLRWGSVAGAWLGALSGLVLALLAGEAPFAGTAALALAGLIAGEIPERFALESYRSVAVATMGVALAELAVVHLLKGFVPPGGLNAAIWTAGWAVVGGPLLYWLIGRLTTPPPEPRLPTLPEEE